MDCEGHTERQGVIILGLGKQKTGRGVRKTATMVCTHQNTRGRLSAAMTRGSSTALSIGARSNPAKVCNSLNAGLGEGTSGQLD